MSGIEYVRRAICKVLRGEAFHMVSEWNVVQRELFGKDWGRAAPGRSSWDGDTLQ